MYPYAQPSLTSIRCILRSTGVLHIGHIEVLRLQFMIGYIKVLWIEANPKIAEELNENIF